MWIALGQPASPPWKTPVKQPFRRLLAFADRLWNVSRRGQFDGTGAGPQRGRPSSFGLQAVMLARDLSPSVYERISNLLRHRKSAIRV
jgi:hypothetical protein